MKLIYGSDIHLEHNPLNMGLEFPDGDILILPGDIVSAGHLFSHMNDAKSRSVKKQFTQFIKKTKKYKKVLYVMGNHEHYDCIFSETANVLTSFINEITDNWVLLDNDYLIIDDVNFIGSTIWTNFNNYNISDMIAVQLGMPDYKWIWKNKNDRITTDFIYSEHCRANSFLKLILHEFGTSKNKDNKNVLITHHPLINDGSGSMMGDGMDSAFFSNLPDLFYDESIEHYFFGHTHIRKEFEVYNTKCHTNGCGYRNYGEHLLWQSFKFKTVEL